MYSLFGLPPEDTTCEIDSIAVYHDQMKDTQDLRIDHITWDDLEMDNVFKRINVCLTSVGEEYLYNLLHEISLNAEHIAQREKLITFLESNPETMQHIQKHLFYLGKQNYNGMTSYIFDAEEKQLRFPYLYKLLAAIPLAFIISLFFDVRVGVVGIMLSFVVNLIVYYRVARHIEAEIPTIGYFCSMVDCCKNIIKKCVQVDLPVFGEMQKRHTPFKSVAGKAPVSFWQNIDNYIYTYLNIAFLINIRKYIKFNSCLSKNRNDLHALYRLLGQLDTAICTMSFRKSLPFYTLPQFTNSNTIVFEDIYHPLIAQPVTNSGGIHANSLITGSNASGKSSFIKTLATNGILAQTLNTCTAQNFAARHSLIISSMAVRDNLASGDSYFVVEVKSLKRIFDMVKKYPCTCYIDEILRGTNTTERVAASVSVLTALAKRDCLCVVASHDMELTRMLPYDNYHFSEKVENDDVIFDYVLKNGASTTRNAIKLLNMMGFDAEVVEMAEDIVKGT